MAGVVAPQHVVIVLDQCHVLGVCVITGACPPDLDHTHNVRRVVSLLVCRPVLRDVDGNCGALMWGDGLRGMAISQITISIPTVYHRILSEYNPGIPSARTFVNVPVSSCRRGVLHEHTLVEGFALLIMNCLPVLEITRYRLYTRRTTLPRTRSTW